jgi:hypothetical protein
MNMALQNSHNSPADLQLSDCGVSPLAFGIAEACQKSGLGRTSVYAAIKSGDLIARKWKRRTVVLAEDLAAFLRNLPKL